MCKGAEALRIQEQIAKAEARDKVFEMMDQHSTKSESNLIKRKKPTIQLRAIEIDIWDDLLYQRHQQHLDNPSIQLLNEGRKISVDNESSYTPRRQDRRFGSQRSSIEVSGVLRQLLEQQSAPDVDIDVFDGNPLNFKYFMTLFREVVESKIEDPCGRLIDLMKYTTAEAKELIKHDIEQPANKSMRMLSIFYIEDMETNIPY